MEAAQLTKMFQNKILIERKIAKLSLRAYSFMVSLLMDLNKCVISFVKHLENK